MKDIFTNTFVTLTFLTVIIEPDQISFKLVLSADAERIGDPINIIKPSGDQRDLQNALVVKSVTAKLFVRLRRNFNGIFGQLCGVIEHRQFFCGKRRGLIVFENRLSQFIVSGGATQQLCVSVQSVMTVVFDRNDRGDHLVVFTRQGQFGRHQSSES